MSFALSGLSSLRRSREFGSLCMKSLDRSIGIECVVLLLSGSLGKRVLHCRKPVLRWQNAQYTRIRGYLHSQMPQVCRESWAAWAYPGHSTAISTISEDSRVSDSFSAARNSDLCFSRTYSGRLTIVLYNSTDPAVNAVLFSVHRKWGSSLQATCIIQPCAEELKQTNKIRSAVGNESTCASTPV